VPRGPQAWVGLWLLGRIEYGINLGIWVNHKSPEWATPTLAVDVDLESRPDGLGALTPAGKFGVVGGNWSVTINLLNISGGNTHGK
jgi:hypothetical protein